MINRNKKPSKNEKEESIEIARQLGYPPKVYESIKSAQTSAEIQNILVDARRKAKIYDKY